MSKLEKFLKESNMSEDAKKLIQEAWNEEKQNVASEIRIEMKERFERDKKEIVEGINSLIGNLAQTEFTSLYDEKRKLAEDRAVIRNNLKSFGEFSNKALNEELKHLRKDRLSLVEALSKFNGFTNNILKEELEEFHQERQQLVETRVKLLSEGRQKLNEAKNAWVKSITQEASEFINEVTRSEFAQLRNELVEAKKNSFGRKIFEAFSAEFLEDQYNKSSELKSLSSKLQESKSETASLFDKLIESENTIQSLDTKIKVLEEKQERSKILSELMKPLTLNQREVMESLLQKTSVDKLNEDFHKYLKPVLNNSANPKMDNKSKLNESKSKHNQTVVTGNREIIKENAEPDMEFTSELENIAKYAGIRK